MGTSVLLVFLAPLLAIYALFGGIFSEIMPSPKAEIVLPYDEAQGLVWEYVEQEDYHINLIEEKIEKKQDVDGNILIQIGRLCGKDFLAMINDYNE